MLESLIRMTEAHARLYMKSEATIFDVISVIVLMEHTLMSCLFGLEKVPSVMFKDEYDYAQIRDMVLMRLELDPYRFNKDSKRHGIDNIKRCETPSPIKKMEAENSLLICQGGGMSLDFS